MMAGIIGSGMAHIRRADGAPVGFAGGLARSGTRFSPG
jgi:hypothetical protein